MEKNKMGVLALLGMEAVFFALLILAYAFFRSQETGAAGASSLSPGLMIVFSLFLWGSSATIWLAGRHLERGQLGRAWLWVVVTMLFGAIFLLGEGIEWSNLIGQGIWISSGPFGTAFFTLTGMHGFHVFAGLVAWAILLWLGMTASRRSQHTRPPSYATLDAVALYWHFVDVVWVVIFSVVYLTLLLA